MDLTADEKAALKALIDAGEPLPDDYRFRLFREPLEAELIWPGKTADVTSVILPFQSIEQIDEPRPEALPGAYGTGDLFSIGVGGRQAGGWSNKLIWGDNKLVLASLKGGPLRREIEAAGGLKLVYIDPPFDVGADFSLKLEIGEGDTLVKEPTLIEEIAYRDTWGRGRDSYVAMLYERLLLIEPLISDGGSICVHCDWRVSALIRSILDEIFGESRLINEIVWVHQIMGGAHGSRLPKAHETLLWYSKNEGFRLNSDSKEIRVPFSEYVRSTMQQDSDGRWFYTRRRMSRKATDIERSTKAHTITYVDDPSAGTLASTVWSDMPSYQPKPDVNTKYPTQKPDELLERLIGGATQAGDLVADFFCGSGTTLAVAEKLGRKWIGADLGRFAVHTSRKRLIGVQRQLKAEGKPYRAFEILNLGKYERQWFAGIDPTLPEAERARVAADKEARYVALILEAYGAQPVEQSPPFHGLKSGAMVLVGPVDAPVTEIAVEEAVDAARAMNIGRVDVLGFEFEMGLAPQLVEKAKAKGVAVALRWIPKDVFDTRAVKAGQVAFYDLAYVEARAEVVDKRQRQVRVSLTDFGVSYRQDELAEVIEALKPGGSKVTVADGQVVKLTKAKSGEVAREVLTKAWTDWIDYWAVDFDYASKPETIYETRTRPDGSTHHVQQWTGRYIFENEWQSFRTRRVRSLELVSVAHTYDTPGRKAVAVKVIDIFGNDTTKVIGVEV